MRFVLFVEGETERDSAAAFLKRWLDLELSQPVGISIVKFKGFGDFAKGVKKKARMHLERPRRKEIIAVVGLLDLYGPNFYPDKLATAADRREWGIGHFQKDVDHPLFRMHFAVHEFEAWLLSEPRIFPAKIQSEVTKHSIKPEDVDFDEHPVKLLNSIFRRHLNRNYKKTVNGKELFAKLDPAIAASSCPCLKEMLDDMLSLARAAGL